MRSPSPTAEGFRLIFRRPAIPLAEIAWRWSFAAAFWFLSASFLFQYADSLPANRVDRLLLGTHQPALILRALHRIVHGSALRFTAGGIVLAIAFLPMLADAQRIVGYRPVTDRQLTEPEASNWLMTRGNYQGWSYSALDQVNVGG